ncbi:MAG: UvrD-helicase domain-containing protein [Clostridia bacterium]|nr:UvrD-helicase domain-containing protein [Clostridia bacterium]MDD4686342.1 UvrD-helicase domain-containing protein [Clostridia bacterium]
MNEFDINHLNKDQLDALNQVEGAVLVTAGAGSGKTRLLTHRIVHLVKNLNVFPVNILAITFTNKAANEMKERINEMLPEIKNKIWISTFHSMCARILRSNIDKLNQSYTTNFSIYADTESNKVITQILAEKGYVKDEQLKKSIMYHISNCKNNICSLEEYENEHLYEKNIDLIMSVFREYQKKLAENNAVDFDDLLYLTYVLLKSNPDVLNKYATRFEFVLVDEFQDTNEVQYELVKMLSSVHKNIFVVGDEDQCIYTWRGANLQNIFKFRKDYDDVKIFKLEKNYRSTKTILDYANRLIKNNKSRIDKKLWSEKESTASVEWYESYDESGEADYVARKIHELVHNQDYKYKDFAILMRLNALSLPFEEKLLNYNIPHKIFGGYKFYERLEVKNVLSYLKLFVNQKDEQAFLRVINFPKRGIGDSTIAKVKIIADEKKLSLLEVCLQASEDADFELPASIINKLQVFADIYKELYAEYEITPLDEFVVDVINKFEIKSAFSSKSLEDADKIMNIDQLIFSIKSFYEKNENITLSDYLQNVSLVSDIDSLDDENDNVIVATVHSVKGLEFKAVFVIGLEEKIFPISRAYDKENEMEEERRLLYVGITRAKENLFLTNCKKRFLYGRSEFMKPSRFLKELGFSVIDKGFASGWDKNTATRKSSSQVDYVRQQLKNVFNSEKETNSKRETGFELYQANSSNSQSKTNIDIYNEESIVLHPKFGIGTIKSIDKEARCADIDFHKIGIKTLMLDIAPLKIVKKTD